ncbi:hypothetical protein D8T27_15625 [Vibrio vulnificus]|nr:hypothetical protein D8T27_15625 [Vibrio vulnificus]
MKKHARKLAKIHTKATFTLPTVISTNVVLYSHHATRRHSRAHGNPFIHTNRMSCLEIHTPQLDNKNNVNLVIIPALHTRCTMDPRLREDDELRGRKRLTNRSDKEDVVITKDEMRQDTSTTPLSHKNSAHRRHATRLHSRAHGNPFIHTRRMPRLEIHSPQPTTT